MNLSLFKRALLILGALSVLVGQGASVSLAAVDRDSVMFMDGPLGHAMEQENAPEDMNGCLDMDCQDCDMSKCSLSHCTSALFHETSTPGLTKISLTNAPGAPPALTGLERQYLPLPPP